MALFPDSGVPPGDAKNSLPDVNTKGCDELWYSTSRCQPRFDPAAANAMLAEDMNLIMRGEVQYDCARLDNIELAVRYIVQRGIPCGANLATGPANYTCLLDPPLTRYNDHLSIIIVPNVFNSGPVLLDCNGLGYVPILRNDGLNLAYQDLRPGVPALISYKSGYWYHVGLAPSQVPLVISGVVDYWIRTDGNDQTGDGSANSPDKAFRTIFGAWARVGSRFAAVPSLLIRLRLGIPGTYVGCTLGPFGGRLVLMGDENNRSLYRITGFGFGANSFWCCLLIGSVAQFGLEGVTLSLDIPAPQHSTGIRFDGSSIQLRNCQYEATVDNGVWIFGSNSSISAWGQEAIFNGNGRSIQGVMALFANGAWSGGGSNNGGNTLFRFNNINCTQAALSADSLGIIDWWWTNMISTNCTGVTYSSVKNSIVNAQGHLPNFPGSLPGSTAYGGQFVP